MRGSGISAEDGGERKKRFGRLEEESGKKEKWKLGILSLHF